MTVHKQLSFRATVYIISVADLFFAEKMLLNIDETCGLLFNGPATVSLPLILPCLPMQISWWSVVHACFFSASIGVFFGVFPARTTLLYDPVNGLRYE